MFQILMYSNYPFQTALCVARAHFLVVLSARFQRLFAGMRSSRLARTHTVELQHCIVSVNDFCFVFW